MVRFANVSARSSRALPPRELIADIIIPDHHHHRRRLMYIGVQLVRLCFLVRWLAVRSWSRKTSFPSRFIGFIGRVFAYADSWLLPQPTIGPITLISLLTSTRQHRRVCCHRWEVRDVHFTRFSFLLSWVDWEWKFLLRQWKLSP